MKSQVYTTAAIILCILFSFCQQNQTEFGLDRLFIKAKELTDPNELDKFSSTHREIAIVYHEVFSNQIYLSLSELLLDSFLSTRYDEFLRVNKLHNQGIENEFILLTAYHVWLNDEVIDFEKIKADAYLYFILWKERKYFEGLKELDSKSYFHFFLPHDDSIRNTIWKKYSAMPDLTEEQREFYCLRALDSIITDGMDKGHFSHNDWFRYYRNKELELLMETFSEGELNEKYECCLIELSRLLN